MKILMWHVHGAWSTSFVTGGHEVVVPVTPARDADGRGLPTTYEWPSTAREATPRELEDEQFDAVVLQRPEDLLLLQQWCGLRAGVDVPAVYVEHNSPRENPANTVHPLAEQDAIPIVHVTHFNALMWDNGRAPVQVIEHGVADPGARYTGEIESVAYVVNEPLRRARVTGTDLVAEVAKVTPVDAFGIGTAGLSTRRTPFEVTGHGDVPQARMHDLLAARRAYVHLCRWTSLGLSMLEAMALGMPVVALATTEAPEALAGSGAVLTNRLEDLRRAVAEYMADPDAAAHAGSQCRAHYLRHFGLPRFHADWDRLLKEVAS
jgi:hypothetical protein